MLICILYHIFTHNKNIVNVKLMIDYNEGYEMM